MMNTITDSKKINDEQLEDVVGGWDFFKRSSGDFGGGFDPLRDPQDKKPGENDVVNDTKNRAMIFKA